MSTATRASIPGDESMIRKGKKSSPKSACAKTRPIQATGGRTKAAAEAQAAVQALAAAMLHNAILALGASKTLPLASPARDPGVQLAGASKDSTAAFIAAVANHRHAEREAALQQA